MFLGSQCSDSQLLRLTAPVGEGVPAGQLDIELQQSSFIDSPAPIHDALLLEDPSGELQA